ncbi:16768_t:CDS:10 [Entrophospora sp. SA101]|nr:16768_t:CDS:10 [Entrophospora sp. SA101]
MSTSPEKTSVQVAVRIRPITEEDLKSCPTKYQHTVITSSQFTPNQVIVQDGDKKYPYNFDHVFGPEDAQKDVFEKSVLKLVEKFLEGYNVTILAYGQTSSGKTHTMGTADNANMPADAKGIIPRSMATLFNWMNGAQYKSRKFSMKVSFIEIYNEELIDLLGEGEIESRPQVLIREDNKGNILWSGLKELQVNNVEDVMSHLTHGSTHRQVGATEMNSKSSRSHAIFSITLSQQKFIPSSSASTSILSPPSTPAPGDRPITPGMKLPSSRSNSRLNKRADDGEWVTVTSKFHFVDLAGSERLKRTSAISERAKEGISINSGLLALGNVISALGDTNKAKHTTHIPYRDSKLTRLLQDSLGGNAQTLMIACVSPTAFNIHETHNTIKYANRARNIKNTVSLNQEETGRTTPLLSNASGRTTPLLSNVSGRTTPVNGRDTPSYLKRPSTPSSSLTLNSQKEKEKEIETLEDQLIQLKKSYVELTQKYAKTSAELAQHQDNSDGIISGDIKSNVKKPNIDKNGLATIEEEKLIKNISASFQEAVEPVIEEYEKSISQLESQLALNKAALSHSETLMQENEYKLFQTEQADQQNRAQIIELKNKLARLNERESSTENYVKDLEGKLESCSQQQKLDQEMIQDLKSKIAKLKDIISNSEMYIAELEDRLASSEDHVSKLTENIGKLEQRLIESEQEYHELEQKSYNTENDREKRSLLAELDDREERIIHLERKVEELIGELENLRKQHSLDDDDNLNIMHIHEKSTSSTTSDTSLFSSNDNSNEEKERLNMILLEGKLSKLQKVHDNTCKEFDDLKAKYQSCLQEMQELEIQILDAKSIHDDKSTTPTTPTTPDSSLFNNKQPLINNLFNNSKKSQNQNAHRKSRTLSTELKSNERRDLAHISIVQKLQDDLKQLSSLHEDKTQGLDAVKSEFARLEIEYREKLEIVEELREEIKRRDALAQLEEIEIDHLDIVQRLKEEIEQLKEEQRTTMEIMSQREKANNDSGNGNEDEFSQVQRQKEIDDTKLKLEGNGSSSTNAANNGKETDQEIITLRQQVEKLQMEIEAKKIAYSSDKLEQNIDENVKELEEKVKDLEVQLTNAKEAQHIPTPRSSTSASSSASTLYSTDSTQKIIKNIKTELELVSSMQQQLEILRVDVKCKYEIIESTKRELIDKGILQQKLRGKEAEAKSLQHQLSGFKNNENEMKQQILQLQEKLKSFKSSSNNNNEVNESLENEINDVKKEMIKAKDNENFTIERLKVLALEETKLQSELDRLKKIEIAQCERIKVLESSLSSSQEQNKNLSVVEKDFTKLKDELSLVKENEIEHKKIIEKLESKLKDSESEIRSSELKLREEEAAKQLIKETDNDNEIKKLKEEIELLNKQEIDQSEKIKSLESQLKLAQENPEIANLKSELVNHEANESLLKDTIQDLETKLSEAQQDSKKLSSIQSELKLLSELDAEQKSSISQLQDQLVNIQNEKDSVVKEMESMKQDFEAQKNLVFTLEKDLNLTKTELTKAKEDNQSSSKKHEDLSALLSQTVEERDQLDKKTKDLIIEIEGLKEMNITDDKEISRLNSELSEAKDEMIRQNELLSELNSKLTNVEKEQSNISNLKSQLEEAKNSSVLDQETISKLNEKLDLLQSQLDESKELDKKRSQKIKELEDRIQETNIKVQEKDNAINNNVELIMGLEENLKKLKSQLENAEKFKSAEAQELESKILELEEQIKNNPTREDLEAVKESYDKQVELTKQLESKLAAADIENSKSILQLTNELVLAKETEESLRKSVKEVEDDLKIKENDLDSLNNNLKKLKEELKQMQSNESQQVELISSLEVQLEQTKNQRDKEIDKFTEANIEIEQLKEKCADLQNEIDEIQKEAMLQSHQSVDSGLYEELNQQLKKSQEENQIHIEHSQQLENSIQKLESEKSILDQNNMALEQNVIQLEKELESLADEYSEADLKYKETESNLSKQKTRIAELEMEIDANKKQHTNSSTTLSQLASASETLRKTNNDLNKKLVDTEENVSKLNQKVKSLEQELAHYKTINDDINTSKEFAQELKDKIKNLEHERDGLGEANKAFVEEKKKLDDKIDSLLQQLQSSGRDGNKTAAQLAELNKKIISLEKEISITKEQSKKDSEEMEKEIIRLLEVNKKLESGNEQEYSPKLPQQQQQRQKVRSSSDSGDSYDSGFSSLSPQASNPRLNKNVKAMKHETTIAEQLVIIKTLQDRIAELEKQQLEEIHKPTTPADLDAVGGFRLVRTDSNSSTELMKNAIKNNLSATSAAYMDAPLTPPPNLPLPPVPSSPSSSISSLASNSVSLPMTPPLSPPPKSPLPPIPDSEVNTTPIQDLTSEVQKLNKKLGKLENENSQSQQLIETLEGALNSNEGELKIAKQQLQILQKEKANLRQQVKALNDRLEEVNAQFEHAQSSVQEEKKVIESIESVLNQERKAKEEAEKARRQLENRMEELIQKKNKFMCF